jgi:hypothetical protein
VRRGGRLCERQREWDFSGERKNEGERYREGGKRKTRMVRRKYMHSKRRQDKRRGEVR